MPSGGYLIFLAIVFLEHLTAGNGWVGARLSFTSFF
jgi:hypothetical protein